jgi:hypothetical protein
MSSAAPQASQDSRPAVAAPGEALAYTPEQAAAIIGGNCKAYYLRKLAREKKVPHLWVGKYAFTAAHISEIVAYCERSVRSAKAPQAHAKPPASLPAGVGVGVVQLVAREPRRRQTA